MFRRSLAAIFWAAAAFTLVMALLPHPPRPPGNPSDKLQHIAAFTTLAGLAAAVWPGRRYVRLGLALSGFGALIEFLQTIPMLHRDAELLDWVADTAAITTVLLAAAAWRARSRRQRGGGADLPNKTVRSSTAYFSGFRAVHRGVTCRQNT